MLRSGVTVASLRLVPLLLVTAVSVTAGGLRPATSLSAQTTTPEPLGPWPPSAELPDPGALADLDYRYVGPIGNRFSAVAGVPGDPLVYYVGAASGGVFRSVDGGVHWEPVFDDQTAQSIGAIAVAPSDPNVVWVGTGEPFIRSNVSHGNGVYRSTDGGDTWSHVGLEESGRIGRVVVHPRDPDVAWVAALGHLYGPQEERGVFKTADGGESWERVLFVDDATGAVDLVADPTNPRILFAATWQMQIRTWGRWSGGPGSGLWKSTDGGESWTRLEGRGLPEPPLGKIGLAISPDDPNRVYALVETNVNRNLRPELCPEGTAGGGDDPSTGPDAGDEGDGSAGDAGGGDGARCPEDPLEHDGVLWRSDDQGETWRMVNADHTLVQRPLYYTRMAALPDDADELHFMAMRHTVSYDGGASFELSGGGGDFHDIWIDPEMPDRMIMGHDQGISISTNRGETWMRPQLPVAQMYHVYTDTRVPYFLYGNRQDGPSFRGPSNTLGGGGIPTTQWHTVGGCESGFAIPDTVTNDVVWSGCYDGILDRYRISTGHARRVSVWPNNPEGWPAGELRDRFQWTFPIHISHHDHERVYVGSQRVHVTENGGQSWRPLSPDLTTDRDSLQLETGGLTPDDSSPTYAAVLFAIAESPVREGVIWAGSNDGKLHLTRDGGENWTDMSDRLPELPPLSTVSNVEPSRFEAGRAYVAVDAHQLGDFEPYLYRTDDFGETWSRIDGEIPRSVLSFTHVIREDPRRPGLLYAGTGNALYVSLDDGERWLPLQNDLPHAPVHWIEIQPHFNDLVVSTYGRGFWILDDITPLQRLTPEVAGDELHLFRPRPAYRFLSRSSTVSLPDDEAAGENPEYGATLHVWMGDREDPASVDARIEVVDDEGVLRRSLTDLTLEPGINRTHWDLREEASRTPKLRTKPLEHPHVEMPERGWRDPPEGGRVRPLAPPGRYTVRLIADGDTATTELEVLKDPGAEGSLADVESQVQMVREIREDVNRVVELIDRIEWLRLRLHELETRLAGRNDVDDLRSRADSLARVLVTLEMNLFDLRLTGGTARQDTLRWPRRLYARLISLAAWVSQTDHRPTDQAREVHRENREKLADYETRFEGLVQDELSALNRALEDEGLGAVIVETGGG